MLANVTYIPPVIVKLYSYMYIFKHGHCSHAQLEDASKVLRHVSISKGAVGATAGGGHYGLGGVPTKMAGTKYYIGIQYILRRNSSEALQNVKYLQAKTIASTHRPMMRGRRRRHRHRSSTPPRL